MHVQSCERAVQNGHPISELTLVIQSSLDDKESERYAQWLACLCVLHACLVCCACAAAEAITVV